MPIEHCAVFVSSNRTSCTDLYGVSYPNEKSTPIQLSKSLLAVKKKWKSKMHNCEDCICASEIVLTRYASCEQLWVGAKYSARAIMFCTCRVGDANKRSDNTVHVSHTAKAACLEPVEKHPKQNWIFFKTRSRRHKTEFLTRWRFRAISLTLTVSFEELENNSLGVTDPDHAQKPMCQMSCLQSPSGGGASLS